MCLFKAGAGLCLPLFWEGIFLNIYGVCVTNERCWRFLHSFLWDAVLLVLWHFSHIWPSFSLSICHISRFSALGLSTVLCFRCGLTAYLAI